MPMDVPGPSALGPYRKVQDRKRKALRKALVVPRSMNLRSRPKHLTAKRNLWDRPKAWYEQRSMDRPVTSDALSDRGSTSRPMSVPVRTLPRELARRVDAFGNWPLPDTPRCAGVALQRIHSPLIPRRKGFAFVAPLQPVVVGLEDDDSQPDDEPARHLYKAWNPIERPPPSKNVIPSDTAVARLRKKLEYQEAKVRREQLEDHQRRVRDFRRSAYFVMLWSWPRVMSIFRHASMTDLEAIQWPTMLVAKLPFGAVPSAEFYAEVPALALPTERLPDVFRMLGLSDPAIALLIDDKLPTWLRYEREEDETYAFYANEDVIRYEDFKIAMAPTSTEDVQEMTNLFQREITVQKEKKRIFDERMAKWKEQQKANRQWQIDDMITALSTPWPPTIRKGQPAFTTKQRAGALEYIIEAGCYGKKAGLSAAALAFHPSDRIPLKAPGIRACLIACVTNGLGLGGLSCREAAETFFIYCAERLQSLWRTRCLARKWARVKAMWARLDGNLLRRCLQPWAIHAHRWAALRRGRIRLKLQRWMQYSRDQRVERNLYRAAFWPVRVWRRETIATIVADDKALLLSHVWEEYTKLRILRGWLNWAKPKAQRKRRADAKARGTLHLTASSYLQFWARDTAKRRSLRQIWFRRVTPQGGAMLRRRIQHRVLGRILVVWKYWTFLVRYCRQTSLEWFRRVAVDGKTRKSLLRGLRKNAALTPQSIRLKQQQQKKRQDLEAKLTDLESREKPVVPRPTDAVCGPLASYFDRVVLPRELAGAWMRYWRGAPRIIAQLKSCASARQAMANAAQHYVTVLTRKVLTTWGRHAADEKKATEDARQRAKDNRLQRLLERHVAQSSTGGSPTKKGNRSSVVSTTSPTKAKKIRKRSTRGISRKSRQNSVLPRSPSFKKRHDRSSRQTIDRGTLDDMDEDEEVTVVEEVQVVDEYAYTAACDDEEDQVTREGQLQRVDVAVAEMRHLVARVESACLDDEAREDHMERSLTKRRHQEEAISQAKKDALEAKLRRLEENTVNFSEHAARNLVETVYRVFEDARLSGERKLTWPTFRALRLPVSERHSLKVLHKQILRHRLRICAKFARFERAAPRYRDIRTKYHIFQLLKRNRRNHSAWRTPLTKTFLLRRQNLMLETSHLIDTIITTEKEQILAPGQHREALHDDRATFRRWCLYAQDRRRFKEMADVAVKKRELRVKAVVVDALRERAGLRRPGRRNSSDLTLVRRAWADLECYRRLFIAARRRKDVLRRMQRTAAVRQRATKEAAFRAPSFKKFITSIRRDTLDRISLEQQLLVEAFHLRGTVVATDEDLALAAPALAPPGTVLPFRDDPAPLGCRIGSIHVVTAPTKGVLGIGATIAGDRGDATARPFHGAPAASNSGVFQLRFEERLSAIDVQVGKRAIEAIRFHATVFGNNSSGHSFGGVCNDRTRTSSWYGLSRCTADAKEVRLAGAPGTEIAGLTGRATPSHLAALGVVLRTVKEETVFSYYWTDPISSSLNNFQQHDEIDDDTTVADDFFHGDLQSRDDDDGDLDSRKRRPSGSSIGRMDDDVESRDDMTSLTTRERGCVDEFISILRYRHVDCVSAMRRAERFARRVWQSRLVLSRSELRPCRKFAVVTGLTRWLFRALATALPPLPSENDAVAKKKLNDAKSSVADAKSRLAAARKLQRCVQRRRAQHDARYQQDPHLRTQRALKTPQWREAEAERLAVDDRDHARAASNHAQAAGDLAVAVLGERHARTNLIRIDPRAPWPRITIARLFHVARHQQYANFSQETDHRGGLPQALIDKVLEAIFDRRSHDTAKQRRLTRALHDNNDDAETSSSSDQTPPVRQYNSNEIVNTFGTHRERRLRQDHSLKNS